MDDKSLQMLRHRAEAKKEEMVGLEKKYQEVQREHIELECAIYREDMKRSKQKEPNYASR